MRVNKSSNSKIISNQRGVLHYILPIALVAVLAIIGVGYLVYSHAAPATDNWIARALPGAQLEHDWNLAYAANKGKHGIVMYHGVPFAMPGTTAIGAKTVKNPPPDADYYILSYYTKNEMTENGGGRFSTVGPPGDSFNWLNQGNAGGYCNNSKYISGTCWAIKDTTSGCVEAAISSGAWWLYDVGSSCTPGSNAYENFSNPPTSSSKDGTWYNLGVEIYYNQNDWGMVIDWTNGLVRVRHDPSTYSHNGTNQGLWSLV